MVASLSPAVIRVVSLLPSATEIIGQVLARQRGEPRVELVGKRWVMQVTLSCVCMDHVQVCGARAFITTVPRCMGRIAPVCPKLVANGMPCSRTL